MAFQYKGASFRILAGFLWFEAQSLRETVWSEVVAGKKLIVRGSGGDREFILHTLES
jgi:hypothetical protein